MCKEVTYMATANFTIRLDNNVKKEAESTYNELGLNLTTAINVFLRKSIAVGGFPFDVRTEEPNKGTLLALLEAEKISKDPSEKGYTDVDEALRELKR